MDGVVYSRKAGGLPFVIEKDGALFLEFGAGSGPNREPRTFTLPITERHLAILRTDLTRHILLATVLYPLGDAAGTNRPLDEAKALKLVDSILFDSEMDVESLLHTVKWYEDTLIAHHANPTQLALGKVFAASKNLTAASDVTLAREYNASRRHLFIAPLDEAILRYTNQYLQGGGLPSRNPKAVSSENLPRVLEVIAAAEQACKGMELPADYGTDYQRFHERDKKEWHMIKDTVEEALHSVYPDLVSGTLNSVSFLMCNEAASRAKAKRKSQ